MIKICYFVEGQTERIFLERLLKEYLGYINITIDTYKLSGTNLREIRATQCISDSKYYIQIFDVEGDGNVAGAMRDRCEKMLQKGFSRLFGLRDVHPKRKSDIPRLYENFHNIIDNVVCSNKCTLLLSVMQIEAWFLSDKNVFKSLDHSLTSTYIKQKTQIDLDSINPENYYKPATCINKIFGIIGSKYKKNESQIHRIVHNLDYEYLALSDESLNKIPSFKNLLEELNKALNLDE